MKKLSTLALLSVLFLAGCHDDAGKAFVGKWQGNGIVNMTEEDGKTYFIDIQDNDGSYLIDLSFPEYGTKKTDHLKYIAKLDGNQLVTGSGIDRDTLVINKETGELITSFKEHINYTKVSSGK